MPQGLVDAAAGFGDGISFGATDAIRGGLNLNHVVNKSSTAYSRSQVAGNLYIAATGSGLLLSKNLMVHGISRSGVQMMQAKNAQKAGLALSLQGFFISGNNLAFRQGPVEPFILDSANLLFGVPLGRLPAIGEAITNFGFTTSSNLVSQPNQYMSSE